MGCSKGKTQTLPCCAPSPARSRQRVVRESHGVSRLSSGRGNRMYFGGFGLHLFWGNTQGHVRQLLSFPEVRSGGVLRGCGLLHWHTLRRQGIAEYHRVRGTRYKNESKLSISFTAQFRCSSYASENAWSICLKMLAGLSELHFRLRLRWWWTLESALLRTTASGFLTGATLQVVVCHVCCWDTPAVVGAAMWEGMKV